MVGSGGSSKSTSLTSSTTPTTVIADEVPRFIRCPIGSTFGQNRSANERLTTATVGAHSGVLRRKHAAPLDANAHGGRK
jgi:hypothetical protein